MLSSSRRLRLSRSVRVALAGAGSVSRRQLAEQLRHLPEALTLQPVEDFFLVLRYSELLVKSFRKGVALVGGPLEATTLMLDRYLTQSPHQQDADTLEPELLGDVQLFEIQRACHTRGRPEK